MKNYVCPDCGKTFEEGQMPASCPDCGCPSDIFKKQDEKKVQETPSSQEKSFSPMIFLILIFIGVIGSLYWSYNVSQKAAEQARQDQYQKEQAQREREQIDREERKKEQEEKIKRRKKTLCKNKWKCLHGDPYGECLVESVGFQEDGTAWNSMTYYAGGNKIKTSSFNFTYYIDGDYIYVQGEKAYYYDGYSLELWPSGQQLKEVSRWEF